MTGNLLPRACPVCGFPDAQPEAKRDDGAQLVSCSKCGLLFVSPAPGAERLAEFYRAYYRDYRRLQLPAARLLERAAHAGKLDPLTQFALQSRGRIPRSAADVGCAQGARLFALRILGCPTTHGCEMDADAAAAAKRTYGIDVWVGDAGALSRPSSGYDAVFLSEVIEHVLDPVGVLRTCRDLLAPDGLLFISTPNAAVRRRAGPAWTGLHCDFDHLSYFDDASLRFALARAGLAAHELLPWGMPSESAEMARGKPPRAVRLVQSLSRVAGRVLSNLRTRTPLIDPSWGFQLLCSAGLESTTSTGS